MPRMAAAITVVTGDERAEHKYDGDPDIWQLPGQQGYGEGDAG